MKAGDLVPDDGPPVMKVEDIDLDEMTLAVRILDTGEVVYRDLRNGRVLPEHPAYTGRDGIRPRSAPEPGR